MINTFMSFIPLSIQLLLIAKRSIYSRILFGPFQSDSQLRYNGNLTQPTSLYRLCWGTQE